MMLTATEKQEVIGSFTGLFFLTKITYYMMVRSNQVANNVPPIIIRCRGRYLLTRLYNLIV